MNCKQCGNPLPEGTAFCSKCGVKQEEQENKYCKSCGNQLYNDATFCSKCGAQQTEATVQTSENVTDKKENKIYKILLTLSEKKCMRLNLSTLFLLAAIVFPAIFLTLITAFFPVRALYILVYVISLLLLCIGAVITVVRVCSMGQNFMTYVKRKLKLIIPYTAVLILLIGVIGFFEAPPSNKLVGHTFTAKPSALSMLHLTFRSNYVNIWLGTYKYSDYSSSGMLLDDTISVTLECSYEGKSTVIIDNESFYGSIEDDKLTFSNTARASLSDTANSKLFRDIINEMSSLELGTGRVYVKNNWDYYFKITDRKSGNVLEDE